MNPKFPEIRKFLFLRAIPVTSEHCCHAYLHRTSSLGTGKKQFPKASHQKHQLHLRAAAPSQQGEQGCSESCCPPAGTTGTHQGQGTSQAEGTPRGCSDTARVGPAAPTALYGRAAVSQRGPTGSPGGCQDHEQQPLQVMPEGFVSGT